ncbi:MAG: AsmA family protein [Deltaproteobacteria bacterium]|nr:AsmA family protein [Deltaproteobacteria bacterium]
MRRFLNISAVLVIILFVLFITASIFVKLYFPPEKVKELVVSEISKALNRKVSVGDVDISLFRGIDINDIYLGENRGYGNIPFVKVKRVIVGYNFSELLKRRVVLDRVTIEKPEVYVRSRNGRLALSDLIKRPPPEEMPKKPLPVTVLLKRGEVRGLAIFYEAEDASASIKGLDVALDGDLYPFKDININLSSKGSGNIEVSAKSVTLNSELIPDLILRIKDTTAFFMRGELSLKGLKAGIKDKTLTPFDVVAGIDLTGDLKGGAEIKGLSLSVGEGNTFNISGNIKALKGLKGLDMKLTGDSDLGEVSRIAERFLPVPVSGSLKIKGLHVAGGAPDSLKFKTEFSLKDVKGSYKGMQLPVTGIIKAEGDSKGNISLSELNINSGDALKVEASANISEWGKGKADGKAWIIADNAKVLNILPKGVVERIGKVEIPGKTTVEIAAGRYSEKGPISVKISGESDMSCLQMGTLSVQEPTVTFYVNSDDLLKGKTFVDAGVKGKALKFQKGDMSFSEESVDISVSASFKNPFKGDSAVKGTVRAKGLRLNKGNISLYEEMADGLISVSGDFRAGDLLIDGFEIGIPELFKANVSGAVKGWGKDLDLKAKVEEIDFKSLMDKIPASIKQKLPEMEVEGNGNLVVSISGGIPPRNVEDAENRISISGNFKAKGLGISIPEKGVKISNSEGDIDFDLSKEVQWVSGTARVGKLEKSGLLEDPVGISAGFELLADGPDIKIKNISASIPQRALSVSISGDVLEYTKAPRLNLDMAFSFSSREKVDLVKGLSAQGAAAFKGSLISHKEKELVLDGGLKFDHLDVSYQERGYLKDINGEIKMSQGVRYAKGLELIAERGKGVDAPYMASLYGLLRPYVKKGYDMTMASASFDGYDAGPLSMDIAWDNGNLLINRYDLTLFDGSTTGKIWASYNKGVPEYSIYSNIAGVKLDRIFKDKKGRELEINADLNLKGKGADIEGEVNVTKIGKDILDRGLLRLDPNESNPQIVDIRRKVSTLGWVPKEASIWIRHGELNMDITLQRRRFTLLNIVSLEKIPVRRVPVGYLIKKALKKAAD